jgi:hypothetical protein
MDVKYDPPPVMARDWRERVARITKRQTGAGTLQNGFAVAALGALLLSVLRWKSSSQISGEHPTPLPNRI